MSSFAKISIRFLADLNQFSSQMQNANRDLQKFGEKMTSIGSGLTLGVTLPILGLGAAAVKTASDAEETSAKFNTVFSDISDAAKESASVLRNSYGLSSTASQQLLSDTGDLLTGFGFSQEGALDLSTEVNKLAVDLASFTNFSGGAEGASQALTKALLGERESVKSLGISILESDVKARVLLNTQQGLTFETERQAKAFATLQIAQEQSKNAIGDYARTSDGFANQMRLLKARLEDVSVQFGQILLPYVTKLAGFTGKLIEKFSNLDESTKKIIVVIGALAAVIGPLLVTIGFLATTVLPGLIASFGFLSATVIPAVTTAMTALNTVILANPIGAVATAVGLLVYGFTELLQSITPAVTRLQTFYNLLESGGNYSLFVAAQLRDQSIATALNAKETNQAAIAQEAYNKKLKEAPALFASINGFSLDELNAPLPSINPNITPKGEGSRKLLEPIELPAINGIIESPLNNLVATLPDQADLIRSQFDGIAEKMEYLKEVGATVGAEVANVFSGFTGSIIESLSLANNGFQGFVKGLIGTVGKLIALMLSQSIAQSIAGATASGAATGPAAIFTTPAFIATAVGGVLGAFAAIPKFADGGVVYGPTLGLIGEYAGARNNPEIIAPLDKLKGLIGGSNSNNDNGYIASTRISGKDLLLSIERTKHYNSRRG